MASRSTSPHHRTSWASDPICQWLLDEGRLLPDMDELVLQLGHRLLRAGAPLCRLRLSIRTLHPLVAAHTSVWDRHSKTTQSIRSSHGVELSPEFVGSPFQIIVETQSQFRRKLTDNLTDDDHKVLHEIKDAGGTDYFGLPLEFSHGKGAILVFTSDTPGGFGNDDINQLLSIAKLLAPIAEVFSASSIASAVAHAYLGSRTGTRVLDGQITRGHIEKINAAILISDIRDWTGLNNRLPNEIALLHANRYFEILAESIESHGGEILKFIGDGVLAVFPLHDALVKPETVCTMALASAKQARLMAQESDPPLELDFGIGMHFGEVLYGNIGSKTRIDFTVMGQAVNLAARVESLCKRLNAAILFSQEFADKLSVPTRVIAEEMLKGYDMKFKVSTVLDN